MTLPALDELERITEALGTEVRARFLAIGFTRELLRAADASAPGILRAPRLPLIRWWLARRPEPGAILARVFGYDDTVAEPALQAALGSELLQALTEAGLLARGTDGFTARFHLLPAGEQLWLLSDSLAGGADAVMGPGAGTEHLGSLVPRGFSGSALDLGCGAGTLALVAARAGARRTLGVDINARAITLARANARLNGLRADFLVGDGVEPARAERFELVLAQPPFVVRPTGGPAITYLHGGRSGDELAERFVRTIPDVLAPGGRALMLVQTPVRAGEALSARLRGLVGQAPVDILVLASEAPTPALQAAVFASFEDPTLGAGYGAAVERYLDHFAGLGITEMRGALVVLTRVEPDAPGRRFTAGLRLSHADYDTTTLVGYADGLALGGQPDPLLAAAKLRLSPHLRVRVERRHLLDAGDETAVLHVDPPGIGADWTVSAAERQLLAAIDAADSVGAAVAAVHGRDPSREEVLALARAALTHGALLREPAPAKA